jgi:hypothetical protein
MEVGRMTLAMDSGPAKRALELALRFCKPDERIQVLSLYLFEELGPVNFGATEVARPGATRGAVVNTLPPVELWPNIAPTIRVAQWLRGHLGRPLPVNSGYRSPDYNRAVDGSTASLHTRFNALDIGAPAGVTPRQMYDALKHRTDVGGLGLYSWGVHIDTRHLLGMNRWRSDG